MTIRRSQKQEVPHKRGFKGKTTKLSFTRFIYYLLELNETDPPDGKKLTDDDIIESVHAEFGTRSISARKIADVSSNNSFAVYRSKYNADKPEMLSIRYDFNGYPCRNYRSPISIDSLRIKAYHYKIVDPRLFTPDEITRILIFKEEYPEEYQLFRLPSKETLNAHSFGSLQLSPSVVSIPKTSLADLELKNH